VPFHKVTDREQEQLTRYCWPIKQLSYSITTAIIQYNNSYHTV